MVVLGLLLGLVGTDVQHRRSSASPSASPNSPTASASSPSRWACSASPRSSSTSSDRKSRSVVTTKVGSLWPTKEEFEAARRRRCCAARCSARPGHPAGRRRGARLLRGLHDGEEDLEGPRSCSATARSRAWRRPKSANNAGAQTSFIPLLTLGIPSNAVMALMVGAHDHPGHPARPAVMTEASRTCSGA